MARNKTDKTTGHLNGHAADIDLPPLKGVPCQFCQGSPHMHWKKNYRLKDMQDSLIKHGYKIGLINIP